MSSFLASYRKFNTWLAIVITSSVSTMECAYFFAVLAIIGFPPSGAPVTAYVQWFSQTFIQLVMLAILSVYQRQVSEQATEITRLHHEHRTQVATQHERNQRDLHNLQQSHEELARELAAIRDVLDRVHTMSVARSRKKAVPNV